MFHIIYLFGNFGPELVHTCPEFVGNSPRGPRTLLGQIIWFKRKLRKSWNAHKSENRSWKKTSGHGSPNMLSKKDVLRQKRPSRPRLFVSGVMMLWAFWVWQMAGSKDGWFRIWLVQIKLWLVGSMAGSNCNGWFKL